MTPITTIDDLVEYIKANHRGFTINNLTSTIPNWRELITDENHFHKLPPTNKDLYVYHFLDELGYTLAKKWIASQIAFLTEVAVDYLMCHYAEYLYLIKSEIWNLLQPSLKKKLVAVLFDRACGEPFHTWYALDRRLIRNVKCNVHHW